MSRILIVDDTPVNVQILAESLKNDYEIRICTQSTQAFELAKKHPLPDLILLDVVMPDLSGHDIIKLLKADPETKEIPVIFVTAKNEAQDESQGLDLGAVDYITKPFQMSVVRSRIKTHIQIKTFAENIKEQNALHKQLIHVLCHDLRNPIGSLSSYLDIVMDDSSMIDQIKKNMDHCVKNALNIIDDIHKFMSVEEKKNKLNLVSWSLPLLIHEASSIVQNRLDTKSIKLNVTIPEKLNVIVDKTTFINSVLNNVFTNAIKFSHQGSEIKIWTEITDDNRYVKLHIKDSGIGIPQKILDNIFNIDKSQSMPGTSGEVGTGFGMPLVKKFLNNYEGDVEIETFPQESHSLDHGTDIILVLKKGIS